MHRTRAPSSTYPRSIYVKLDLDPCNAGRSNAFWGLRCHHTNVQHQQQQQQRTAADDMLAYVAANRRGVLTGMLGTTAFTLSPPSAEAQTPTAASSTAAFGPDTTQSSTSSREAFVDPCSSSSGSNAARGAAAARDPSINSGCATPADVRHQQQLAGLVPPRQVDLRVEVMRAQAALDRCSTALEKHRLLVTLKETNQAAFYALLQQDVATLLPLVYTPTIGDACLNWGTLLPRPTGLYVTLRDKGNVAALLQHWATDEVRLAVITDGERILGLGDLGAHGMGIPTGKCVVYGAAGAKPEWLLPVTVDVGTNNRQLQQDPLYIGLPQERLRGQEYVDLMAELVVGLQQRFGRPVLVHWEDLAGRNAFQILQLARSLRVPTFNDDIQATAAVALAAVLGAVRMPGVLPLTKHRFLFFGAGQASIGTARLLVLALQQQGNTAAAAKSQIWMVDSKGLIVSTRADLTPEKVEFAQNPSLLPGGKAAAAALESSSTPQAGDSGNSATNNGNSISGRFSSDVDADNVVRKLAAVVAAVQPTALVGAAAVPGAFGQPVIKGLLQSTHVAGGPRARPVVLALSNPTSKVEVSYADAMRWSSNKVIYASGSPYPPLYANLAATTTEDSNRDLSNCTPGGERSSCAVFRPGQANNCLVFPGLGLGTVESQAAVVTDDMLLAAAQAVAGSVTAAELSEECVLPDVARLQEVTAAVKTAVIAAANANLLVG